MKYQTKTRVVEAITFDELVEYGRSVTPQNHLMNGMPWAFKFKGHHVTHENDACYLILGLETDLRMTPGDMLIVGEHDELYTCMHDIFARTYTPVCDGNHGGDPCADPECWQHPVPDKKAWAEMQDELVRDATRYRFLRDSRRSENLDSLACTTYTMESLDEAIDAALKEERDAE